MKLVKFHGRKRKNMEEAKKCAKCGKELCDECVSADDATLCKECGEPKEDCANCADKACCGGDKEE